MNKEFLQTIFTYDQSGNLIRKNKNGILKNRFAGSVAKSGYTMVSVKGYGAKLLHRLVWIYHNGDIPKGYVIDHIDGDKSDNRIENLQCITQSQNTMKASLPYTNTSGYRGVSWHSHNKAWVVDVNIDGKRVRVGQFKDKIDAAIAYDVAATESYGRFAQLNFPEKQVQASNLH